MNVPDLPETFELTLVERDSPLWARLTKHIDLRLERLRLQNDSPTNTEAATAALRGRIAAFKELRALGTAPLRTD